MLARREVTLIGGFFYFTQKHIKIILFCRIPVIMMLQGNTETLDTPKPPTTSLVGGFFYAYVISGWVRMSPNLFYLWCLRSNQSVNKATNRPTTRGARKL